MSGTPLVKVPIGPQSVHWNTAPIQRTVLVLAHNVTTTTRLLDVVPVFDSDPRVQVVFSWNGADPFRHGLDALLGDLGVVTIPWDQAIQTEFDLAITANHSGLTEINAPVVVLSHGIGYTKHSPGSRKPEAGSRKPEAGSRKPEAGKSSGCRRSGCSTTVVPSPRRSCSPTPNNAPGSPRRHRPRSPMRWWRAIPATTGSSPAVRCATATGRRSG